MIASSVELFYIILYSVTFFQPLFT